jgi:FMN phosphatase YigB (HAD superfamily)
MLFIFDMDNVLYDYHWRKRMESLTDITGYDFHDLRCPLVA